MADRIVLNTISYHGHGAIENIVPELTARGYKKAFVCSDPDLIKFGVTKKVTDLLDAANFAYAVYSEIKPNPTIANVQDGVAAFKAAEADCIVTIGGGSSMDTAKAIGIIINNPEFADVRSLEGVAPTKKHAVFTIAVPTTAGTAAEVTINYVITDVEKKRKFVCVDTNDIPEIAVVDPDMMSSMPKGLTAATGMDALTHAIEGYITKGHCTISDMFHLEAIGGGGHGDGEDSMLLGGCDTFQRADIRELRVVDDDADSLCGVHGRAAADGDHAVCTAVLKSLNAVLNILNGRVRLDVIIQEEIDTVLFQKIRYLAGHTKLHEIRIGCNEDLFVISCLDQSGNLLDCAMSMIRNSI